MTENYIIIGIALVIIFLLVKFITRIFFKFILPLIIAGGILYYLIDQGVISGLSSWKNILYF